MSPLLYAELAPWWPLMSPPDAFEEEAAAYLDLLQQAADGPLTRVLELGSGGGNLAVHFPERIEVVLVDLAPEMLEVSKLVNPGREHIVGDMRTIRLERTFDAVLIGDAIQYMLTPEDVAATLATAFAHVRPGGSVLVLPDSVKEIFEEHTDAGGVDALDGRAVRFLEWNVDPDPEDHTYETHWALMLKEADGSVRHVHERHEMGLFDLHAWGEMLSASGFVAVGAEPMAGVELGVVFPLQRPVV